MSSSVENRLISMIDDLSTHHNNRQLLMEKCVQERLTKALKLYYNEMKQTYLYLEYRNENNLLNKYRRTL